MICGAGVSGTANFNRIVNTVEEQGLSKFIKISIIIIEKSSEFGPGFPYSFAANNNDLLHVPAIIMSINPEKMSEFVDFLGVNNRMTSVAETSQVNCNCSSKKICCRPNFNSPAN